MRAHCDPECEWNDGSDACCTPSAWEQELMDRSDRYRAALVAAYQEVPVVIARVCDRIADPTGALLGEIRQESRATNQECADGGK
jgi:hypothetical protein